MIPQILKDLLKYKKVDIKSYTAAQREEFQRFLDKGYKIKDFSLKNFKEPDSEELLGRIKDIGILPEEQRFGEMRKLSLLSDRIFRLKVYNYKRKEILEKLSGSKGKDKTLLNKQLNKMPTYLEYFFWRGKYVEKGNRESRDSAINRLKRI